VRLDHITPRRFVSLTQRNISKEFHQTLVTRLPLCGTGASLRCSHPFPGGYSAVVPPDPIPNSEVKRSRADGSVNPHARVGHRQGLYPSNAFPAGKAFVFARFEKHRIDASPPTRLRTPAMRARRDIVGSFFALRWICRRNHTAVQHALRGSSDRVYRQAQ
jgi:hypothetical protein